tara:strand:+ start:4281 stop:4652 length:372 start_codon:yes stop_codon:yes gene_type:complete
MASQSLDITTTQTTAGTVSGLFTLNNTNVQTVTFDNTNVSSATIALTTSDVEYIAASVAKATYVTIKNLDPTNYVIVSTAAPVVFGRVLPGETSTFCLAPSVGMDLKMAVAGGDIEYAFFRGV